MSKRVSRTVTMILWLAALALCGFAGTMLMQANRPSAQLAQRPLAGDPDATGSVQRMRWCGASSWCR